MSCKPLGPFCPFDLIFFALTQKYSAAIHLKKGVDMRTIFMRANIAALLATCAVLCDILLYFFQLATRQVAKVLDYHKCINGVDRIICLIQHCRRNRQLKV